MRTFDDRGRTAAGLLGSFVHSLTLTDIHSGWTECAALVVREQTLVVEGISLFRHALNQLVIGSGNA